MSRKAMRRPVMPVTAPTVEIVTMVAKGLAADAAAKAAVAAHAAQAAARAERRAMLIAFGATLAALGESASASIFATPAAAPVPVLKPEPRMIETVIVGGPLAGVWESPEGTPRVTLMPVDPPARFQPEPELPFYEDTKRSLARRNARHDREIGAWMGARGRLPQPSDPAPPVRRVDEPSRVRNTPATPFDEGGSDLAADVWYPPMVVRPEPAERRRPGPVCQRRRPASTRIWMRNPQTDRAQRAIARMR